MGSCINDCAQAQCNAAHTWSGRLPFAGVLTGVSSHVTSVTIIALLTQHAGLCSCAGFILDFQDP